MRINIAIVALFAGLAGGCGGAGTDDATASAPAPAPAATGPARAATTNAAARAEFTVDSTPVSFRHRVDGDTYYLPAAAAVVVRESAGGKAGLAIRFMAIDLRAHPIPGTLPPEKKRGMSPIEAMQNVGFSYTDAGGTEWTALGKVHVESFSADRRLVLTFDDVTLHHTGKSEPDITLSNGRVEATLD